MNNISINSSAIIPQTTSAKENFSVASIDQTILPPEEKKTGDTPLSQRSTISQAPQATESSSINNLNQALIQKLPTLNTLNQIFIQSKSTDSETIAGVVNGLRIEILNKKDNLTPQELNIS